MKNKSKILFLKEFERISLVFITALILAVVFAVGEIFYLQKKDVRSIIEKKQKTVQLIKLPDLAVVTEATWLRHRSISNVFTVFPEDGSLLDYYPASFIYKVDFIQNRVTKK